MKRISVRAVYRAAKVEGRAAPYDNVTLKIHYPCAYGDSFEERDTGFVPPDASRAPFPVVVIMPGVNISQEAYGWIAKALANAGFAAVTYHWVTVEIGDRVSASPGVAMAPLMRDAYGKAPSCPALPALLDELGRVQSDSLLAGLLDLDHVILGGHSAGGTMALLNANRAWFAGVCGAFSYAAHSAGNLKLGWEADSIMPLAPAMPLLIMGGTRDGVIAASGHRYRDAGGASSGDSVQRTFHEGVPGNSGGRHLLIVEGANHFAFVWPMDTATGRPYLDWTVRGSGRQIRDYLAEVVVSFCRAVGKGEREAAKAMLRLCDGGHPLAAVAETK